MTKRALVIRTAERVGAVRGRVMGLWACIYMALRGACLRALGGGDGA